ncbi:hypothetical protein [Embleya sp. NPDC020886]|uniref:hypothetical protein n=1 Tax=Embleya sp. NPDC020886 TaxID=3363980 RepID=UPI0037BDBEE8
MLPGSPPERSPISLDETHRGTPHTTPQSTTTHIRDRTLEGQEFARRRGRTIGGAGVADDHTLSMALHLRDREMSLRDIAARLVITTGKKEGRHPSPATVMRMLREHDETTTQLPDPPK